jgi:hypothetical protein
MFEINVLVNMMFKHIFSLKKFNEINIYEVTT